MMELILHKQNLEEFKFRIKNKFPQLTDADLKHAEGKEDRMIKKVANKLRLTNFQIQSVISGF